MVQNPKRRPLLHEEKKVLEWEQSLEEVNIYITPPKGVTAQMILCEITSGHLLLKLKGIKENYLNHDLFSPVIAKESYWMLNDEHELNINLQKMKKGFIWSGLFRGMAELDPITKDEIQKKIMLERFQEENPGFDFSNAEFNGAAPDPRTFMGGVKYT